MSSTTPTRGGFPPLAAAVTGGIAAALVMATMPHVYIEDAVGITGIAELLPAAAPPLGNTARGIIALLFGGMAAAAIFIWLTRNKGKTMDMSAMKFEELREKSRQGAMSDVAAAPQPSALKNLLAGLSPAGLLAKMRGGKQDIKSLEDLPKLREADSHPDTPARKPIFASEDLGAPLTQSFDAAAEPFDLPPLPATQASMVVADNVSDEAEMSVPPHPEAQDFQADWSDDARTSPFNDWQTPSIAEAPVAAQAPVTTAPIEESFEPVPPRVLDNGLAELSIGELTERLAQGFETLRELQGLRSPLMTKSSHGISISPVVEQDDEMVFEEAITQAASADSAGAQKTDMDAALRAALGTLEAMTEQSRRAS